MDAKVIESWDELLETNDTEYVTVEITPGKAVRLGSLSAADMLAWIEDNEDKEKIKTNGIVLVTKCLVDSEGKRIGDMKRMLTLREKQPRTMKKLIQAAVELNKVQVRPEEKNDSSEATPAASPTDSASL